MNFVGTGAWYALYVPTDPDHPAADDWLRTNRAPLLTTDYVLDETLTLMRARGQNRRALEFGLDVFGGALALIHSVTPADLAAAWDVFRRFADKEWSFTDCTSKVVVEALGVTTAFAFDQHFRQFGTIAVVP